MTERIHPDVQRIADRYRLTVDVARCTAGHPATGGFFTYELTPADDDARATMYDAAKVFRADVSKLSFLYHGDNPEHPQFGKPYLSVESVWHKTTN
jgi:hypothetical protein